MTLPFRLGAIAVLIFGAMGNVGAETTTDRYGKELKIEPARNVFARFGLLGLKLNNKSEAAKDMSGPVLAAGPRGMYCNRGVDSEGDPLPESSRCQPGSPAPATIFDGTTQNGLFAGTGVDTLGIPADVRARIADPLPGAIGTLGMYLDENKHWAVEAPVMALPFDVDIFGEGSFKNAGKIITGKTLGFLIFGHYYFGNKDSKFRPSVSLTANYLAAFDLQATPSLVRWTGGTTKITSKGSFGFGWMVGGKYALNDRWDINLNVGQFKAKVENTLTTYDTVLRASSPIFTYWPGVLGDNLRARIADSILDNQLRGMMAYRNSDPANRVNGGANLGNFTRKQTQTLDPYVLMMTVGYNF